MKLLLTVRNTSFSLEPYENQRITPDIINRMENILKNINYKYKTYNFFYDKKYRKKVKKEDKIYFNYIKHKARYTYHINCMKEILGRLGNDGFTKDSFVLVSKKEYTIDSIDINLNNSFIPKGYQDEFINKILASSNLSNLIDLPTGYGKSLVAAFVMVQYGVKGMFIMLPRYIVKWVDDMVKYTDTKESDIYVVRGMDSLLKLLEDPTPYKYIILATRTFSNIMSSYENNDNYLLDFPLEEIAEKLKVGFLFNDETHQEFHCVFKSMLYFNVKKILASTATLIHNSPEIVRMYNIVFPPENRVTVNVEIKKYLNIRSVLYSLSSIRGIKMQTHMGYSHPMFEQQIMMRSYMLKDYIDMIDYYFVNEYYVSRKPGQVLLIFVSRVNMAMYIKGFLKQKYPELNISTYVEDDEYETIFKNDVIISTHGSAGTALDIPNLTRVFQTVPMMTKQGNVQNPGRLRNIEEEEVIYYYFYTNCIPAHKKYHFARKHLLINRTKTYIELVYSKIIKSR